MTDLEKTVAFLKDLGIRYEHFSDKTGTMITLLPETLSDTWGAAFFDFDKVGKFIEYWPGGE